VTPAEGHSGRFGDVSVTSGLALKADIHRKGRHVSKVPIPEVASLFDHPVDAGAERRRKFERCRSASIFRTPGDYLFKCRDCKHNGGKDRTCIGDKRAIMCADCAYALPDDHEPRNIATDKHAQSVR
jgi:hypothetical protein